jgi:hypothetical protein
MEITLLLIFFVSHGIKAFVQRFFLKNCLFKDKREGDNLILCKSGTCR